MEIKNDWIPEVKDWEEIPLETYKFIFGRVEKKFDDILNDSEILTGRAIKLLTAVVLSISYFVAVKFEYVNYHIVVLVIGLYGLDIGILIKLIFPKTIICRGASPKELFIRGLEVDNEGKPYNDSEKKLIPYYYEIIRLQTGIDINRANNRERQELYRVTIFLSAIILALNVMIFILSRP